MTKNEFLSIVRGRITGAIPSSEVESQIDYYSAYIDGRIGAGLTEEEAVEELGDPLLIAKTVIESTDRAAEAAGYDGRYRSSTDTYDDSDGINSGIFGKSGPSGYGYEQTGSGTEYRESSREGDGKQANRSSLGSGLGCIIAVIIFILVIALVWVLSVFVFRLTFGLIGWLLPGIAVFALVMLVINLARRR